MRVPTGEMRDEISSYLQQTLGSSPQYIGDNIIVDAVMRSADEITPMLPNSWHDDESKKMQTIDVSNYTLFGMGASLRPGWWSLPADCLEARNIDLNEPDERSFIVYSEADFAARKARMGRLPVPGLFEMVFYQQGRKMLQWYNPTAGIGKNANLSYVVKCADPADRGGYFYISERGRPLIVAHAVAHLKLQDLRNEDFKLLWQLFIQKWSMAVTAVATTIANDPFVHKGNPVVPISGGTGG
jgi:hypothetical protein